MKKSLFPVLMLSLLISGCTPNNSEPTPGEDPAPIVYDFALDFSYEPTSKVVDPEDNKEIPYTIDTDNKKKFAKCLNSYYLPSDKITLESSEGGFVNLLTKNTFTKTRNEKLACFGSGKHGVDMTWTFSKKITNLKVYTEPYVKYDSYHNRYNIDNQTYLQVNNDKRIINPHSESEDIEISELEFTVNSNSIHFVVPHDNIDKDNKIYQRVYVSKIEFKLE